MNGGDTNLVLCEVARDIVADIAPHELPIFPAVSSAYLADPAGALRRRRSAESALGFGTEALSALATIPVLYILSELLKGLAEAATKAVADSLAKEATAVVKAAFKRFREPGQRPVAPALAEAQLAAIRGKIVSAGRDLQLPADQVEILVKAITAQLAVTE
jgi:hypothetical protein